jgi:hypothetical protein
MVGVVRDCSGFPGRSLENAFILYVRAVGVNIRAVHKTTKLFLVSFGNDQSIGDVFGIACRGSSIIFEDSFSLSKFLCLSQLTTFNRLVSFGVEDATIP